MQTTIKVATKPSVKGRIKEVFHISKSMAILFLLGYGEYLKENPMDIYK